VNAIARFEQLCARVVEGTFARIFPSALEPVHVGRKLIAAQNAAPTDTYLVRVHPVDYVRFAADREFLEARWSALLRENARGDAPRAVLHEDPAVVAGAVRIEAIVDDRATVDATPGGLTLAAPGGKAVPLRDGLRIGRNDDNDVVVRDGRASRVHARIVADGERFAVEDAGSTNGTFVDGERVGRATLHAGTSIVIGETVLEVRG
jgi:hypothetical protein